MMIECVCIVQSMYICAYVVHHCYLHLNVLFSVHSAYTYAYVYAWWFWIALLEGMVNPFLIVVTVEIFTFSLGTKRASHMRYVSRTTTTTMYSQSNHPCPPPSWGCLPAWCICSRGSSMLCIGNKSFRLLGLALHMMLLVCIVVAESVDLGFCAKSLVKKTR